MMKRWLHIQQEHSGVGSGVQGTCQELPGHCGVSWLPVGLEMPPWHWRSPEGMFVLLNQPGSTGGG